MWRASALGLLALWLPVEFASQAPGPPPPPGAAAYVAQGHAYLKQRQLDRALEAFRQALALEPELADAHVGLGVTYHSMARPSEAEGPLRTAVRYAPRNAAARLNLGITLASLRREEEALSELREARNLDPLNPKILSYMGAALNALGRIEEALEVNLEARRLEPKVPELHHNAGLMLMRLGRFGEAIPIFEGALRLNPSYRNARYHLSHAYNRTGRCDDAVESWTKFLDLGPDDRDGLQGRVWNRLYAGRRGEEVAGDATRLLQIVGWRTEHAPFLAILAHIGHRQAGARDEARAVLDEATVRADTTRWPWPIVRYLRREIAEGALLDAADTNDRRTEARTFLGMDLLIEGQTARAREHFLWVREYGNKRFLEYPLAVAELGRMGER